jgi:hypothetical protein
MKRYALAVALIAAAGSAIIEASGGRLDGPSLHGAILGAILAALGAVFGMALLVWSFERGTRHVVGAMVLGMLGRLALFGGVLIGVGLLRPANFGLAAVAASLLGFYFVFQVMEVRFLMRGLKGLRS